MRAFVDLRGLLEYRKKTVTYYSGIYVQTFHSETRIREVAEELPPSPSRMVMLMMRVANWLSTMICCASAHVPKSRHRVRRLKGIACNISKDACNILFSYFCANVSFETGISEFDLRFAFGVL